MNRFEIGESILIVLSYGAMWYATVSFGTFVIRGEVNGWYRLLWLPCGCWALAHIVATGILIALLSKRVLKVFCAK